MPRITEIKAQQGRASRVSLFVDGDFFCGLEREVLARLHLTEGQEIIPADLRRVLAAEEEVSARERALRLLDRRARSADEIRRSLVRHGISAETIEAVLRRLQASGLVNDAEYARLFIRDRIRPGGMGRRRLLDELRRRGVDRAVIEQALEAELPADEAAACLERAKQQAGRYHGLPRAAARRRLASYLIRRGYAAEAVFPAVAAALPSHGLDSTEESDPEEEL